MEGEYQGVTYAEVREWIVWLRTFTIADLADAMAVNYAVAERFTIAAMWHGIIDDTGDSINGGPQGEEVIWYYVPIPNHGPTHHPHRVPPEKIVGYTDIVEPRGITQMLISDRDRRQSMSQPGVRLRIKNRERARRRAEEAKMERLEIQRKRELKRAQEGRFIRKAGKRKGQKLADWE